MTERMPWRVTPTDEQGRADYMLMEGVWPGADIGQLASPSRLIANMVGGPWKTGVEMMLPGGGTRRSSASPSRSDRGRLRNSSVSDEQAVAGLPDAPVPAHQHARLADLAHARPDVQGGAAARFALGKVYPTIPSVRTPRLSTRFSAGRATSSATSTSTCRRPPRPRAVLSQALREPGRRTPARA